MNASNNIPVVKNKKIAKLKTDLCDNIEVKKRRNEWQHEVIKVHVSCVIRFSK